jgi:hypothetical protein
MDHSHLPTINFLCDVNSRVRKVREEQGIGSTLTARLRAFEDEVQKHRDNKIKESTLIKRGSSFLAQFPDLQARFWHVMEDPRAAMKDQPKKTVMTGRFAPLEPFLVWSHILHCGLSHIEAARMAGCCKWLRRMVTPRFLVSLRQPWEDSLPVTVVGGAVARSRPLRLKTTTGQEAALYIINSSTRLLGLGYEGKYYVLDTNSVQDTLRVTRMGEYHTLIQLFTLLDNIATAPADEPLDLRMWAKIAPLGAVTVSMENTAHGEFGPIERTLYDDGVKHKFFARGIRVFWGPL